MKENVMDSEFLDIICAVISSDLPNNSGYKILFINTSYYTDINKNQINLRCYDICSGLEISDNSIGCVSAIEYYMYHFIKNYKENKSVEIHLINNQIVNLLYTGNTVYLYEKTN